MTSLAERLSEAGFPAPVEDAEALLRAAGGSAAALEQMVARRLTGEPLEWITGRAPFFGMDLHIVPGVYVPRPQTELLAARAVERVPARGGAVADLATGCGAVAAAVGRHCPSARVVATDIDEAACRCARSNGVVAFCGHLGEPLAQWAGRFDFVTAVVPYVPTAEMAFLPRDVLAHEPPTALDGGVSGRDLLKRAVDWAGRLLRPGGTLLLELGGDQDRGLLEGSGFVVIDRLVDEDGDLRAIEAVL